MLGRIGGMAGRFELADIGLPLAELALIVPAVCKLLALTASERSTVAPRAAMAC